MSCVYLKMKRNQFGRVSNYALFHQSLVDLAVGLVFLLHELSVYNIAIGMREVNFDIFSSGWFFTYTFTRFVGKSFTVLLCVLTLLMNTSDRFMAIYNPLKHRKFSSLRRMVLCTFGVWLAAFLLPLSYIIKYKSCLFDLELKCDASDRYYFTIAKYVLALIGVFVVQAFLYKTYKTIQLSLTKITEFDTLNLSENCNNNDNKNTAVRTATNNNDQQLQTLSLQSERRSFNILLRMSLTYIVTFIPMSVMEIIHNKYDVKADEFKIAYDCSQLLYISSAIINPLLTLTMRHSFKEVFVKGARRVRSTLSRTNRSTLITSYN